jgi:hypothetical protein
VGLKGWLANKAGWPTRLAAQQGWLPNKASWPTSSWANKYIRLFKLPIFLIWLL